MDSFKKKICYRRTIKKVISFISDSKGNDTMIIANRSGESGIAAVVKGFVIIFVAV